jgi:hypothetical protein
VEEAVNSTRKEESATLKWVCYVVLYELGSAAVILRFATFLSDGVGDRPVNIGGIALLSFAAALPLITCVQRKMKP